MFITRFAVILDCWWALLKLSVLPNVSLQNPDRSPTSPTTSKFSTSVLESAPAIAESEQTPFPQCQSELSQLERRIPASVINFQKSFIASLLVRSPLCFASW